MEDRAGQLMTALARGIAPCQPDKEKRMDNATKQFDPGSGPAVATEGFDDPATVLAAAAPAAPEPDADGTAQQQDARYA